MILWVSLPEDHELLQSWARHWCLAAEGSPKAVGTPCRVACLGVVQGVLVGGFNAYGGHH